MSRVVQTSGVRLASRVLVERSVVCEYGGGFETERWCVRVNDGWLTISKLLRRGAVGGVSAEMLDEDDPSGALAQKWVDRPPQVYFRRRIHIVAPIGTRFWQRIWRPAIDRKRTFQDYLMAGDVFPSHRRYDEYFELRAEDRLVPERILEAKRNYSGEVVSTQPLSEEENRRHAEALVSMLGARATSPRIGSEQGPNHEELNPVRAPVGIRRRELVKSSESARRHPAVPSKNGVA